MGNEDKTDKNLKPKQNYSEQFQILKDKFLQDIISNEGKIHEKILFLSRHFDPFEHDPYYENPDITLILEQLGLNELTKDPFSFSNLLIELTQAIELQQEISKKTKH